MDGEQHAVDALDDLESRLSEVRLIRASTRRSRLTAGWKEVAMWGVIFLVSVPVTLLADGRAGWYWAVTVPLGIALSFVDGLRPDASMSADGPVWPYVVIAALMTVGAVGAFAVFSLPAAVVAWWLVLVTGLGAMSWLDGHRFVAAGNVLLVIWGLAVALAASRPPFDAFDSTAVLYSSLAGALGAYLVGVAAALRTVRS